ncbi:MAG: 50S ribosomal protein L17 [Planctomycetota bacterium]|nr:50S ribosomal protein L17 [Planctomycetota bacterium]
MRHMKSGRKLGRNTNHRRATLRNIARNLFIHERITTTPAKAKAARRFAEKLITLARKDTLHARRLALSRLPDRKVIDLLFEEIAPRFVDRPGGYTRIIPLAKRRLGDAAPQVIFELVDKREETYEEADEE